VLLTSLIGESFIFLFIFNPLVLLTLATKNVTLFLILLIQWLWMVFLIYFYKFKKFNFLIKIQNYFFRYSCLHFIGNYPGKQIFTKIGNFIIRTPLAISAPAAVMFVLEKEAETGHYACEKLLTYREKCPNLTVSEEHKHFSKAYYTHANSTVIGRSLVKLGIMSPPPIETFITTTTTTTTVDVDKSSNFKK
jgi:hypothetical protein